MVFVKYLRFPYKDTNSVENSDAFFLLTLLVILLLATAFLHDLVIALNVASLDINDVNV